MLEPVEDLVARAAAGDRAAESALCLRFAAVVRAFARRRLRTRDAVDEFTQDVMLVVVEAVRSGAVEDPARVAGFVLGVCRNLARDRARTAERRAALWQAYGAAVSELEAHAPERSPKDVAHLEDCLSQLSQRAREVVRWSFIEGESNAAIAARLTTSEGNVRVLRHRTLKALRDCMSAPLSYAEVA